MESSDDEKLHEPLIEDLPSRPDFPPAEPSSAYPRLGDAYDPGRFDFRPSYECPPASERLQDPSFRENTPVFVTEACKNRESEFPFVDLF